MTGTIIMIAGVAVAYNIVVVKMKMEHGRTADAWVDLTMLIVLGWLFSGSEGGLMIGTVASAIFSTYLFFDPPRLDFLDDEEEPKTNKKF